MAARKTLYHPEEVKEKIRASQLINRLHQNALEDECMTPSQVTSAITLLDRVMPKLKAVEHSGEVGVVVNRKTVYEARPDK